MPKVTTATENGQPVEIAYEDQGQGAPIVLIHGWPLSGRAWEPQVLPLVEAGFRVITYDRRGFGDSSRPWDGYDYDTMAADLDALLQHLDVSGATLVGFSMGGGEVARYLGRFGSARIAKAVFASAVPPFLYKTDDNPDGGLEDAQIDEFKQAVRDDRVAFLEEFTSNFYTPAGGELQASKQLKHFSWNIATLASQKATLDCIDAWGKTDFRGDLEKIDVPVLVIHGDADQIVPIEVSGQRTADATNGKLVVLEGAPHGCNATHAEKFNEALISFAKS